MVTCSYCHHGIDRLTAVTTHGYTCTQHLSLTVPTVCDYKYCRASHHSSNSCSHFLTKRAITHPWAFVSLEICAYLHVRLFSIMCAEALLFTGCSEQQKKQKKKQPSTSGLSASMAEHTSQVCVCPHLLM